MKKRAAIYMYYDQDGIVDQYMLHYVRQMKTVADYLVVVCNGQIRPEGRKQFLEIADDFFVRDNMGFNAWALKEGLEYIGWDKLKEYDELIYGNATFFGPFRPFAEIMEEMEGHSCDYWGINRVYEDTDRKEILGLEFPWGKRPECVACCFYVFRSQVLHSYEFRSFWNNLPPIPDYSNDVVYFEMSLGVKLTNAGFTFETLDGDGLRGMYPSPTVSGAYDMVQAGVPFVRRKAFCDPNGTVFDYGEMTPRKTMEYIRSHTDYDVDMIWENLIRTNDMYQLKNWMQLDRILPADYCLAASSSGLRIGVIVYLFYTEVFEKLDSYLHAFPEGTDILILTDEEEKREFIERANTLDKYHVTYGHTENRGRDVSALLIGGREMVLSGKYDLICFFHDKMGARELRCVGSQYGDHCYENVAASPEYVENVIGLFAENKRLGLAVPPSPSHANYYVATDGTWGNSRNYNNTVALMKKLGLSAPMSKEFPPVAPYGTVFWFRVEAVRQLFEQPWSWEDFEMEPCGTDGGIIHAIERVYPYVAQANGYYTSLIEEVSRAEARVVHMAYETRKYTDLCLALTGRRGSMSSHQQRNMTLSMCQRERGKAVQISEEGENGGYGTKGRFKRLVKTLMPRPLWNMLRKAKCKYYNYVYVE